MGRFGGAAEPIRLSSSLVTASDDLGTAAELYDSKPAYGRFRGMSISLSGIRYAR